MILENIFIENHSQLCQLMRVLGLWFPVGRIKTLSALIHILMLLLIVFSAIVAPDALSSPSSGNVHQHEEKEYDLAGSMQKLVADAHGGSAPAQFVLGQLLYEGIHLKRNLPEARRWYKAAAEQGHMGSQFFFGIMLDRGEGGQTDEVAAAQWYEKAADQGHIGAMVNLGANYLRGEGVEQDEAKARSLLESASEHDDPRAFYGLGLIHEEGRGVPVDLCRAIHLYQKSAALGFANAVQSLARLGKPSLCEGV